VRASEIERAGVVGAGTMGNGIAHVFARAGIDVRLVDVDRAALDRAVERIETDLDRQVARGALEEEAAAEARERIRTGTELTELEDAGVVVEAVPERLDLKADVWEALSEICREGAILASNTSSISITELGSRVARPGRFLGMHFMNPVPVMELVEVIRGLETDDETAAIVLALCERLGKTPVEVEDFPGFVSNRVLMPMINEAAYCLLEGVADAGAIDRVMKLGMNHPMGPLRLADLIGLDTCLSILEVLHRDLGEDKYRPCPLLRKYVAAGRLGRKSGRGFHAYDG